jgi:hypothetical protein
VTQQQLDRCLSVTPCSLSSASSAKKVCLTFFAALGGGGGGVAVITSLIDAALCLKATRIQVGFVEILCAGSYGGPS